MRSSSRTGRRRSQRRHEDPAGASTPIAKTYFAAVLNAGTMPPPPALPLSAYEEDVLRGWNRKCAKRPHNQRPHIRCVSAPRVKGTALEVTVDVTDGDGETVIGKLTSGRRGAHPAQRALRGAARGRQQGRHDPLQDLRRHRIVDAS